MWRSDPEVILNKYILVMAGDKEAQAFMRGVFTFKLDKLLNDEMEKWTRDGRAEAVRKSDQLPVWVVRHLETCSCKFCSGLIRSRDRSRSRSRSRSPESVREGRRDSGACERCGLLHGKNYHCS